jgi:hypothetical protein
MTTKAMNAQEGGFHYLTMELQPWEVMKAWMSPEEFQGFLKGNVIKYMGRAGRKEPDGNPLYDAKKARHYLDAWIEFMEEIQSKKDSQ